MLKYWYVKAELIDGIYYFNNTASKLETPVLSTYDEAVSHFSSQESRHYSNLVYEDYTRNSAVLINTIRVVRPINFRKRLMFGLGDVPGYIVDVFAVVCGESNL